MRGANMPHVLVDSLVYHARRGAETSVHSAASDPTDTAKRWYPKGSGPGSSTGRDTCSSPSIIADSKSGASARRNAWVEVVPSSRLNVSERVASACRDGTRTRIDPRPSHATTTG